MCRYISGEAIKELGALPGIEVRVNRFLAEGYNKSGNYIWAKKCLKRIIMLNDPDSEITEWARLKRIEIES